MIVGGVMELGAKTDGHPVSLKAPELFPRAQPWPHAMTGTFFGSWSLEGLCRKGVTSGDRGSWEVFFFSFFCYIQNPRDPEKALPV